MKSKQYKLGETVIEIRSTFEIADVAPYTDYLCFGLKPDYIAEFEVVDSLPSKPDNAKKTGEFCYMSQRDDCYYVHYWDSDSKDFYACRIASDDKDCCKVLISKKYEKEIWTRLILYLIGIDEILAKNNSAIFHSSYLDFGGEALLFTGPCGMGKSTQADLWNKYRNLEILNGDKSLLYEKDGVYMAGGLPYSGSSNYCVNKALPIKAIVKLSQAPYNKVEKLDTLNGFLNVYKGCYPAINSQNLINKQMDFAEKLSAHVDVYHLECLPDESAVICLERELNGK